MTQIRCPWPIPSEKGSDVAKRYHRSIYKTTGGTLCVFIPQKARRISMTSEQESPDNILVEALVEKISTDIELNQLTQRRIGQLRWIAVAILALAILGVTLLFINHYSLRAEAASSIEQSRMLTETNSDLMRRDNKLRVEIALRDARFQASKSVIGKGGSLQDLLHIQGVVDDFGSEIFRSGNGHDLTADDVRREACARLGSAGQPCMP